MRAIFMRARAGLATGIRSLVALTLILGVAGGVVLFTAAGARRTDTAYSRLVVWARTADSVVSSGGCGFSRVDLDRVAGLPQVETSARVYQVGFANILAAIPGWIAARIHPAIVLRSE
jgi:hypothetical protein